MKSLLCLIFLLPVILFAQQNIKINLTFGDYFDDQVEHKFISRERVWNLDGKTLDYSIDANDLRYVDTLILTDAEIMRITHLLTENEPLQSIIKDLKSKNIVMHEMDSEIRGNITFNNEELEIMIVSDEYSKIESDKDVIWLNAMQQLFYEIVENHTR